MGTIQKLCIEGIHIKSFKDIKECHLSNLPINAPWIFLTGENGMGKTVFLQALATGLHPIDHQINDTQYGIGENGVILINLYAKGSYGVGRKSDGSLDFKDRRNFTMLTCYGPSRLQTLSESDQNERVGASSGLDRLFGNHTFLKNIDFALIKWELKKDSSKLIDDERQRIRKRLEFTKKLLIEMLDLVDIEIDISNDCVLYIEKGTDNSSLKGVRSFELGAGYRNLLGFVGDLILNLNELQPLSPDPSELLGIVIIDEIELHLHPQWQKVLPGILSKYFKKIQFIASTHSPIPLLGAPEGSVFLKVDRTLEEGIQVTRLEKLEKDIKFLQPNAVFTSDIFDFDSIESKQLNDLGQLRQEDHYKEIEINDRIKDRLSKIDDEKLFPEDLFETE